MVLISSMALDSRSIAYTPLLPTSNDQHRLSSDCYRSCSRPHRCAKQISADQHHKHVDTMHISRSSPNALGSGDEPPSEWYRSAAGDDDDDGCQGDDDGALLLVVHPPPPPYQPPPLLPPIHNYHDAGKHIQDSRSSQLFPCNSLTRLPLIVTDDSPPTPPPSAATFRTRAYSSNNCSMPTHGPDGRTLVKGATVTTSTPKFLSDRL